MPGPVNNRKQIGKKNPIATVNIISWIIADAPKVTNYENNLLLLPLLNLSLSR